MSPRSVARLQAPTTYAHRIAWEQSMWGPCSGPYNLTCTHMEATKKNLVSLISLAYWIGCGMFRPAFRIARIPPGAPSTMTAVMFCRTGTLCVSYSSRVPTKQDAKLLTSSFGAQMPAMGTLSVLGSPRSESLLFGRWNQPNPHPRRRNDQPNFWVSRRDFWL